LNYLRFVFSHSWFATVQDVLHADWQDVWHSPQPFPAVFFNVGFAIVLMFFMYGSSLFHANPASFKNLKFKFLRHIKAESCYRLLKKGLHVNTIDCSIDSIDCSDVVRTD